MQIRLQRRGPLTICGYLTETSLATCGADIDGLWQLFEIRKQELYTVCNNTSEFYGLMWRTEGDRYCYLIGMETARPGWIPNGAVPAAEYAVASVSASASAVAAWTEFYGHALPDAGLRPAPGHIYDFEYYPGGGGAGYELWTPIIRD